MSLSPRRVDGVVGSSLARARDASPPAPNAGVKAPMLEKPELLLESPRLSRMMEVSSWKQNPQQLNPSVSLSLAALSREFWAVL